MEIHDKDTLIPLPPEPPKEEVVEEPVVEDPKNAKGKKGAPPPK